MYYHRLIEKTLKQKMRTSGAVVVMGPKSCGKTTTCMQFHKSMIRLNTENTKIRIEANPKAALAGEPPHLIDEWQVVPDVWNQVKADLDIEYVCGKYLLTGSAMPVEKERILHSGSGRIVPLIMRTMSLLESGESSGEVSLTELFDNKGISGAENSDFSLEEVAYLICRGGWPHLVGFDKEDALDAISDYYESLFMFADCSNEEYRKLKTRTLKTVLRSFSRNISTSASIRKMCSDLPEEESFHLDYKTFNLYAEALKDLYILEDLEAWNCNSRSKTVMRTSPVHHFFDTSLACQALGLSPKDLLSDMRTFGLMFEDFAVRDLKIYSQYLKGEVRGYRDSSGLECDAILHLKDGRWGAIEIKIGGGTLIEAGVRNLLKIKEKVRSDKDREPSFLMILTACGPSYQRKDGIYIVPINLLGV